MGRDDEIDDQVYADWEFTRRAQQLLTKLQTQGKTGPSPADPERKDTDARPEETDARPDTAPPKHK